MKDTGMVAEINKLIRGELTANHTYLLQALLVFELGQRRMAS